jgi:hypothetical protein
MSTAVRLPSLALPFGVLGLVGGALTARAFGPRPFDFDSGGAVILLTTALLAMRLGGALSARFGEALRARPSSIEVVGRALLAGARNGVLLLAILVVDNLDLRHADCALAIFPGSVCAAMLGALVAVPFLPSLLVVASAHRRALLSRPESLLGRVLARRVWMVTGAAVAAQVTVILWATRGLATWRAPPGWADLIGSMALAGGVAALALALREAADFARLRRAADSLGALILIDPRDGRIEADPAADYLDLGVGDDRFGTVEVGGDPYRATDRAVPRLQGDPAATRAALLSAARADALALCLSLLPVALAVVWSAAR